MVPPIRIKNPSSGRVFTGTRLPVNQLIVGEVDWVVGIVWCINSACTSYTSRLLHDLIKDEVPPPSRGAKASSQEHAFSTCSHNECATSFPTSTLTLTLNSLRCSITHDLWLQRDIYRLFNFPSCTGIRACGRWKTSFQEDIDCESVNFQP
jgi:hypothetical protein